MRVYIQSKPDVDKKKTFTNQDISKEKNMNIIDVFFVTTNL